MSTYPKIIKHLNHNKCLFELKTLILSLINIELFQYKFCHKSKINVLVLKSINGQKLHTFYQLHIEIKYNIPLMKHLLNYELI